MDPATLAKLQANILFWIIIALFAWQGYQRGLWSELVKFGFIITGFLVGQKDLLGRYLLQAVNGIWLSLQFLIHGGLKAILTGNFNADTLNRIFQEIGGIRLIPKDRTDIALFLAMIFLIFVGYAVSKLAKRVFPGLGLVAGAFNGLLLSAIFIPILPKTPPFQLESLSLAGIIKQLVALFQYLLQTTFHFLAWFFGFLNDIFGQWTIPILLLSVIVLILFSLNPAKKKG